RRNHEKAGGLLRRGSKRAPRQEDGPRWRDRERGARQLFFKAVRARKSGSAGCRYTGSDSPAAVGGARRRSRRLTPTRQGATRHYSAPALSTRKVRAIASAACLSAGASEIARLSGKRMVGP